MTYFRHGAAIAVCAIAVGVLAPQAGAHTVRTPTPSGTTASTYQFFGRAWQAFHRVSFADFVPENSARAVRIGSVSVNRFGGFTLNYTGALTGNDEGRTHRICFAQFDTRFGRTFRTCTSFYVHPPTLQFMPATILQGQTSVVYATGFPAGRILDGVETSPTGVVETFTLTTRFSGAFLSGTPFGRIYVPRGGAALLLPSASDAERGTYTSIVRLRGGTLYARSSETVL
jgi:hypothetical protein